ncbi:MAG TPA: type II secretion system minor pseudopilin GspJ [Rhodanobacteraceae bacterium]|nr:type II secretion system minor pseudopilin GspJ [Rhodanobacteraceae bacterium]
MTRRWRGFSLIELLVAVAIFAVASAMAWAGVAAVARTRERLAAEQDAFAAVTRSVELMARDLEQAVVRPVLDNNGVSRPALIGDATHIEFSRDGYLGAPGALQSSLERVAWQLDNQQLIRLRWRVLDRAPTSVPLPRTLDHDVRHLNLRYLDHAGHWQSRWPAPDQADPAALPRAVEFRLDFASVGELRRVIELVNSQPIRDTSTGGEP